MPLNKLDNFIKNTEGRILYVNPNDLDATDSITNQGNSLAQPFKTIQRALLEAARFSYIKGNNNDLVEKTTILLFPGEHVIDNRPGFAIYDNGGAAFAVSRAGGTGVLASSVLSLDLNTNFDLTQEDNILYKFNSFYGGVVVPRGTSIVGLDLRKTKIRPKYVPNPTDSSVTKSAIFRITGACYFWQFSIFDADVSSLVYTNPDNFDVLYQSTPTFSHHKLTCFEYCDGVNNISTYGLTDLDMYYSKVSNAYNAYRDIDQKYPVSSLGFNKRNSEWEIVGASTFGEVEITSIISGNGSTASSVITVTTSENHNLNQGTPIRIKGVGGSGVTFPYNITTTVQNVLSPTQFTYLLPSISSYPNINPSPSAAAATVTIEADTVSGASPYIFNISLRSVWGMNGLHADGSKASGFRSVVTAQFTAISLQKDDRAFAKYDKESRTYQSVDPITAVYGSALSDGSSQSEATKIYHLDPGAIYRRGWETSHIKISNNAFAQIVSVFAIGFTRHFDAQSGGDGSITNSNSNFGQISLNSSGFKDTAFNKDNNAFITSIIPPRSIESGEDKIEWLSINVGLTTQVGVSSHLYITGFTLPDSPPLPQTQGFRIGAKVNDKLYVVGAGVTYSASVFMCNNVIAPSGFTTALGTNSSLKYHKVIGEPSSNSFTIGANNILTGEKIIILSDNGDLPENVEEHKIYYAINNNDNNTIKIASSYTNAILGEDIDVYKGANLNILSRVSDKDSGDLGSPIQYDPQNKNWFVHVNANNEIYNAFASGGVGVYGSSTDLSYVVRTSDTRSLDEKIYKLRVVIPKELPNAKDPESGFVIQESSTTGARDNTDFTRTSIASTDYEYARNPRFISTCSVSSNTITVVSELPHNINVGDIVNIKNVTSSTNTTAAYGEGYNGSFEITQVTDAFTFSHTTTDVFGKAHTPGTFTNDVNTRNTSLPRYERNDLQSNLYVYRNEVISPYIYNQQDGVYHLYVLDASNRVTTEFTNLEYSQSPVDLYPQLDRDNIEPNPPAAKTFAKRAPLGAVVTNDLKNSITRESTDLTLTTIGIGLTISTVSSTSGIATLTFSRAHGYAGIATGTLTGGSSYTNGTYYNVKLLNGSQTGTWNGATAKVVVSAGSVSAVDIISPGSGYSAGSLYFDQTRIGAGNGGARYTLTASGISTAIGEVVQITGIGTTSDGYYRVTSVPSSTSIAIAKTAGDPIIVTSQYVFRNGPSVRITSSSTYDATTGITTFITSSAHGLLPGNQFRVIDSSSNNVGDFIVEERIGVTSFTAVTNRLVSASSGFALKHAFSSNRGVSGAGAENIGTRHITFYGREAFTLVSAATTQTTLSIRSLAGIGTAKRLPLGSYIQVDNEIMRITSTNNSGSITVIRGSLGTRQENHDANSLVRRINPISVEFRRPSILRASGHTFEYLGYGPGNYSTALPQVQLKTLDDRENILSNSQENSCGVVVYTGMNNAGDVFSGNTKTSASSGEVVSYDIPKPTVTGEDPNNLSVVYDEVTIKQRLLVEGGVSGAVLSQFDGPVTFTKDLKIKAPATFNNNVRLTQGTQSNSSTTGDLIVSGGVGVGKNINVGGNLTVTGIASISSAIVNSNLNVVGITTVDQLNINTTGIAEGDLGSNGGSDGVFGIYNTTNSGSITLNVKNSSGTYNSIVSVASTIATINGELRVTDDITAFYSSDRNLKDNITPIQDPLSKVLSISGNTFEWNDKSAHSGKDVGVIAQEIEEILPEIVTTRNNGYKAVNYEKLVPLLIEAIKELSSKVEILEQKLEDK